MRKGLTVVLALIVLTSVVSLASAQMVNYGRRAKRTGAPPPPPPPATKAKSVQVQPVKKVEAIPVEPVKKVEAMPVEPVKKVEPALSAWATVPQSIQNEAQEKNDMNGDGQLQPFETKIYLRDIIDEVQATGGSVADTDILKSYDGNGDGRIDETELARILEDVGK